MQEISVSKEPETEPMSTPQVREVKGGASSWR